MVGFRGHPMVRSLHPTTIEVTTDEELTVRGDCIIGVRATKGCAQLSRNVKEGLRTPGAKVKVRISVGGESFVVRALADPRLELSNPHDIVVRKSFFVSDRTLALGADRSARDLPRSMVQALKDPEAEGTFELEVSCP